MNKKTLLALSLSILSPVAFAGGYAGGNVSVLDYSENGFEDMSVTAAAAKLGFQATDHISGELRVGFGLNDDSATAMGEDISLEIDNYFGAYGRVGMPVGDFYPYAVAGFTRVELTAGVTSMGVSMSDSGTSVSYGVGVDYSINEAISLNAEYMNLYDRDAVEIGGFSVGATYHF
ncbi:porin family protein [Endozoicomonas elysicola]|uniref:Outer membrane protein beta-barrel domain-containing protein n=1 Tax=Endozoicomonas elysicola TaxID=305900 RepID=A0A081KBD4_9GAMM|nr:porin family protein [Endozoicomonas elysicola]KEI71460.1 hypothetical protein GV64_12545 [Endozoicomonas elysicola]